MSKFKSVFHPEKLKLIENDHTSRFINAESLPKSVVVRRSAIFRKLMLVFVGLTITFVVCDQVYGLGIEGVYTTVYAMIAITGGLMLYWLEPKEKVLFIIDRNGVIVDGALYPWKEIKHPKRYLRSLDKSSNKGMAGEESGILLQVGTLRSIYIPTSGYSISVKPIHKLDVAQVIYQYWKNGKEA